MDVLVAMVAIVVVWIAGARVDSFSLAVIAISVLAPAAFVGTAALGFALEIHDRKRPSSTARPDRIRRVTRLALWGGGFAIFATFVFGGLPLSASLLVAMGIAIVLAPAMLVYRWPGRGAAIMWSGWSALVSVLVALLVSLDGDRITVALCFPVATLLAILVLVLPVVALVGSERRATLPRARVQ